MGKLRKIAQTLVQSGKGILAADESTPTCTNRFHGVGIESTENTRNTYRSLLFTSPNLSKYISGVILFDETFNQTIKDTNETIPHFLKKNNILAGIKVDTGAKNFANHGGEKITEGLDGLRERLQIYKQKGADFAKWRAVISISNDNPSEACLHSNANSLARYASLCQENDIVPIVEPEVLMDGNHSIEHCFKTTDSALHIVFQNLKLLNVDLNSIILKPNMILPGKFSNENISNKQIAKMTLDVLRKNVPDTVPGVAFLSGGQSCDLAAKRLNTINKLNQTNKWHLTFSYGRALQKDALSQFAKGSQTKCQDALIERSKLNHLACLGKL
tara:strand:- start:507 stop:1496 length:990 start_codon:yes stop_codon:yes gene_type:complete